ncbi:unnamed protein product [Schistocephalus solidus]|uniref:Uncharacterized protein n=1 Tax=Schistocephalus solidus TaxID=70667 RepID=A0A183TUB6_SCHSO|nr:unnamed protein product [Schistocephalus solidus]
MNRLGIHIVHKPASSLSRIKDPIPNEQQIKVIYRIPCGNGSCVYVRHTGRQLGTRSHDHKLAVRHRGPLSLVFADALECGYRLNWDEIEVVAMANTKGAREVLETCYSCAGSINHHVDLDVHYEGLRSQLIAPRPKATSTTGNPTTANPTSTLTLQHQKL